jgi:hypothetical protein
LNNTRTWRLLRLQASTICCAFSGVVVSGFSVMTSQQRANYVLVMKAVRAGDDDTVRLRLANHPVEIGGQVFLRLRARRDVPLRDVEPALVHVADGDQFAASGKSFADRGEIHARARAHTDVRELAAPRSRAGDPR